jgi:hypothetical protein
MQILSDEREGMPDQQDDSGEHVRAGERRCIKCLRHGGRRLRESGLRRRYLYVVGTIRTFNNDEGRNTKL